MKIHTLTIAALVLGGLASCKKDYTCKCATTITGSAPTYTTSTINNTAEEAKKECRERSGTVSLGGYSATISCDIE